MIINGFSAYEMPKEFEKTLKGEMLSICSPNFEKRYAYTFQNYDNIQFEIFKFIAERMGLSYPDQNVGIGGFELPKGVTPLKFSTFVNFIQTAVMGMGDSCFLVNKNDMMGLMQSEAMRLVDIDYAKFYYKSLETNEYVDENFETFLWNSFCGEMNFNASCFLKTKEGYKFTYLTVKILSNYILDLVSQTNDDRAMKVFPHEYGKIKKASNVFEEEWPLAIKGSKKKAQKVNNLNQYIDTFEETLRDTMARKYRDSGLNSVWILDDTKNEDHPHHTIVVSDIHASSKIGIRSFNEDVESMIAPIEELEDLVIEALHFSAENLSYAFKHA